MDEEFIELYQLCRECKYYFGSFCDYYGLDMNEIHMNLDNCGNFVEKENKQEG